MDNFCLNGCASHNGSPDSASADYQAFLASKRLIAPACGLEGPFDLNPMLFPFQRDIASWALRKGRAAIFADCGMGKTPIQLEWARHIPGPVLILAPLAVSKQTIREGEKFGVPVVYCKTQDECVLDGSGINITNYERLDNFTPEEFTGIVLDESSILKAYDGKFRNQIITSFAQTPYRLACTATPAPNDFMELGNHSEFIGTMSRTEMLSMFFVHDGGETQKWRLKGHAQSEFWRWICSWAVMIRKPSDLGYPDGDFILPPLNIHQSSVNVSPGNTETLFPMEAQTLQERQRARKDSIGERVAEVAKLANELGEQWLIWCNLNAESEAIARAIPDATEVKGSDSQEHKEMALVGFAEGMIRVLVTKPSIAGFGLNFQSCHNVAFVGLSDSYEQFYQAVRRCWRFGQRHPVNVHVITAETEGAVVRNIERKEADAARLAEGMVANMSEITKAELKGTMKTETPYMVETTQGENWNVHLGDCVEVVRKIPSDSVHYSIFSPPFASLYTYSNSDRDMGNSKTYAEFFEHFKFLVKDLFRVIMPGRLLSFHCMNLPTSKAHHGYIGIQDFRGHLIKTFQDEGWIYHSEVCIWKDPVTAMQRTKALGLLHKQLKKDSCMSRQGIPDYLVTMRKPGENPERVAHTDESFPVRIWQKYASPIWMDINPNDTLQYRSAREHRDERHICPLQLEVIRRAVNLWTNEGDVVFSPFAGIGSEGYVALEYGRKFIGIELKRSYYEQACRNLAKARVKQGGLFG